MHDDMQIIRQLDFEKCLIDGQIPCRWVPDLGYQYGYPLFNYYPPLPYIIGEIFRIFRFSFIDTIKLVAAFQIILTAYFMYLLGKSLTNRYGGLLSSIFYTYAPYHAVNIYVRGAMNEAWASTFFPLVFYFIRQVILSPKLINVIGLAISFSAILLSHNPMALIFAPVCVVWALIWLISTQQIGKISIYIKLFFSALLSIALSAFLTLPLLAETKLVQVETMFSGYYNYSVHFANIYQLFISNFWGDGPSVWGPEDKMSFMIGYLQWLIPLIITIIYFFKFLKTKRFPLLIPIIITFLGLAYAFMAHERSTFLWILFPTIQNVQFPWRFLNPVMFLLSLSSAYFVQAINSKKIFALIIFLAIALNFKYFYPIHSGPITDQQKLSGESWRLLTTASIYDYLPKTASTAAKQPAKPFIDEISPSNVEYEISGEKKGTDWLFFNLFLKSEATITLPVLSFPNFRLFDYGKQISYTTEPELGRITTQLSAGSHQIYLKLYNTSIRTISNYISLLSWLFILVYLILHVWNNRKLFK